MIRPWTRWQKIVGYTALTLVGLWTAWGMFAIWAILTDPHR